ncbi:hypothetical protein B566_EDAN005871 [Ephemera danica]|nr:hypothetical protein B566_EDAN005871 [Ephemera danica]
MSITLNVQTVKETNKESSPTKKYGTIMWEHACQAEIAFEHCKMFSMIPLCWELLSHFAISLHHATPLADSALKFLVGATELRPLLKNGNIPGRSGQQPFSPVPGHVSGIFKHRSESYFWHITDIHYDVNYTVLGDPSRMCWRRRESSGMQRGPAPGHFGHYSCDSPWALVQSAASAMKRLHGDNIEFVLWTGWNT